ncbi:MAG: co-chaperone DjlA [Gammaproteobacteria bacterium]|nr:co-chaperone DjlA [Gammaproteobacteria bacterium]MDH5734663.1 co-chaperone DjlA [Gammaproteobacteria bacterium]
MSWWGKVVGGGFGFMLGGPLGAIMGAALGHHFDKGLSNLESIGVGDQQRTQAAFFTATFSIMGFLAKVDGHVSKDEIAMAQHVMAQMNLSAEQKKAAIALFNEGKASDFPLNKVLQQFRMECHRRTSLLRMFMEILISTAMADGVLHAEESKVISSIGQQLGFDKHYIDQLLNMINAQYKFNDRPQKNASSSISDAYAVLGVDKHISDAELKKTYRRLMSQHHPDKLVSKGLPEEMISLANEKTHEIKSAYELIRQSRK